MTYSSSTDQSTHLDPHLESEGDTSAAWREPSRRVPLGWGTYELRYTLSIGVLVLAGAGTFAAASAAFGYESGSALVWALAATALAVAAALITPTTSLRRLLGAILNGFAVAIGGIWLPMLLVAPLLLVASWLVIRSRPGRSFAVALPLASLFGFAGYAGLIPSFHLLVAFGSICVVGSAWLGRLLAPAGDRAGARRQDEQTAIQPPRGGMGTTTAATTNTLAIVAFVLVLTPATFILGIVFAHVSLGQIRRSGSRGRGLAIATLWIGYVLLAICAAAIIWFAVILAGLGR